MSKAHDFRYDLRVQGADVETLAKFKEAFDKVEDLSYCMDQDPDDPALFSTEVMETTGSQYNETVEEALHELSMQFPDLTLHFVAEDLDDATGTFELRYKGDMYQRNDVFLEETGFCPPVPFEFREGAKMTEFERFQKVSTLTTMVQKNLDFDLLDAANQAIQCSIETGDPVPKDALTGVSNLLTHLTNLGEALGRFQYRDTEPPFPLQPGYVKKDYAFEPAEPPKPGKVYILCEEKEDELAIRESNTIAIAYEPEGLQKLMQAKIAKDEYGHIGRSGIKDDDEMHFKTNFEAGIGFVSYDIYEQEVLSKGQIDKMLQQPAYQNTFKCPDNLQDVVADALHDYADGYGYSGLDIQKATNAVMQDQSFQAIAKTAWWNSTKNLTGQSANHARLDTYNHIEELLNQNPEYFAEAGAFPPTKIPENFRDILMDSIYDVSKEYHLPVLDAAQQADEMLRDPGFRRVITRVYGDFDRLAPDSGSYLSATWLCYDRAKDHLRPEHEKTSKPKPRLTDLLTEANRRKDLQASPQDQDKPLPER